MASREIVVEWAPSVGEDLTAWLARVEEHTGISADHANAVRGVWRALRHAVGPGLRAPAAGAGGDLGFYFSWNYDDIYVGVDIAPDGRLEWFAKDPALEMASSSGEEEILRAPSAALVAVLLRRCAVMPAL